MSDVMPPQSTGCSPNKSVSVSSLNVVLIRPALALPTAFPYANAFSQALPVASCSTATSEGTPLPSTYNSRIRCPGALGATIQTSTPSGGLLCLKWMLKPCAQTSDFPGDSSG